MTSFHPFFENDVFVIDEKVRVLHMTNAYRVYNQAGIEIGTIQETMPWHRVPLRVLSANAVLPFTLDILAEDGTKLASISRGVTLMFSKITVKDGAGNELAKINQKFNWVKPKFELVSPAGEPIGMIKGDWMGWSFQILDRQEQAIGTINKEWNGAMKEIFTTADKYIVTIDPKGAEDSQKIAIVASAITIDMVLKERS